MMEEIGRGAQYRVLDMDDGKVCKIPLTARESFDVIAGWYAPGEFSVPDFQEFEATLQADRMHSVRVVRRIVAAYPGLSASFGSPVSFAEDGAYVQEKVTMVGDYLRQVDEQQGRECLDNYIEVVETHWQFGVAERVHNLTVNNGIDRRGRMALVDFGEVDEDIDATRQRILARGWMDAWSYNQDLPLHLKDYYTEQMTDRMTLPRLAAAWAVRLSTDG